MSTAKNKALKKKTGVYTISPNYQMTNKITDKQHRKSHERYADETSGNPERIAKWNKK